MTSALCCGLYRWRGQPVDDGGGRCEVDQLDELRTALEDAKREALEAAAAEAEAAEAAQASYYNAGYTSSYASAASCANGSGLTRSAGVNNYNGRRETYLTAAMCFITIARANGLRILRAFGAIPTAITLLPRAIWPGLRPLRAPRVIARSMTPAALPEPPSYTGW